MDLELVGNLVSLISFTNLAERFHSDFLYLFVLALAEIHEFLHLHIPRSLLIHTVQKSDDRLPQGRMVVLVGENDSLDAVCFQEVVGSVLYDVMGMILFIAVVMALIIFAWLSCAVIGKSVY